MTREELWLEERPKLERYLRRRVSRTAAQDIIDEAFDKVRGETPDADQLWHAAWLVEQNHHRAVARRLDLEQQASLLTGVSIPSIETAILRNDFDRAFRSLPRPEAEAFALVELRGLTQTEAADVLGVSQPTVHRRCEAARTHLQKELS